jgi:hypothetical protein
MIRIILIAIATVALGVASFASVRVFSEATASDNVTPHDADVDWSGNVDLRDPLAALSQFGAQAAGGRPVAETNVDANGNIKVAQQGVAEVSMVSMPGTVRTIFDGDVGPGSEFVTDIVDVENCDRQMILFAERDGPYYFNNLIGYEPSPDGVTVYADGVIVIPSGTFGLASWAQANLQHAFLDVTGRNVGPFMRFRVVNGGAQHITIQLYCR